MLNETQDQTYFDRMASSLGDKVQLVENIVGKNVLDVGAGGGELSEVILHGGWNVWALDGSPEALAHIVEKDERIIPINALAHEINEHRGDTKFDTVVCSSILHEVYSYGTDGTDAYTLGAVVKTLTALRDSMNDGGRLLIRDGIAPTNERGRIHLHRPDGVKFLQNYVENAPFMSPERFTPTDEPNVFEAALNDAMEFMYTYTWGEDAFERESQELYGIMTEPVYRELVESVGFRVIDCGSYMQPGYWQFLHEKVSLTDLDGNHHPWPATNFVMVAEKV